MAINWQVQPGARPRHPRRFSPGPALWSPVCPDIVRGFVVFRAKPRPSFLPLSDSITNGNNKLTHPVRCLYFSSQRNEHRWRGPEFFWKHDINIKTPTVTQSRALAPVSPTLFFCAGSYLTLREAQI